MYKIILFLLIFLVSVGCKKKKEDNTTAAAALALGSYQVPNENRPFAVTYTPRDGDTNVSLNVVGTVTFSEPMDLNTITINTTDTKCSGSIQISCDEFVTCVQSSKPLSSNGDRTFTMTPITNLVPNTKYKAKVTTDAKNLKGKPFLTMRTTVDGWTTGTTVDVSSPKVALVYPTDGAVNISKNSTISVTFTEAMEPSTIIANTTDTSCETGTFLVSSDNFTTCLKARSTITIGSNNVDFVFQPAIDLTEGTTYKVKIKGTVKDASNVSMGIDYIQTIGFTTATSGTGTGTETTVDTTPPTVSLVSPLDGAKGVTINSNITATFSEALLSSSVTATSFAIKQGTTTISGAVTLNGSVATFNPDVDLAESTTYTAILTTSIKDASNNALAVNYIWTFTTGSVPDTTAPLAGG